MEWSRRQESNLHFTLRRRVFYPLNYGERPFYSLPGTLARPDRKQGRSISKTLRTKAETAAWAKAADIDMSWPIRTRGAGSRSRELRLTQHAP